MKKRKNVNKNRGYYIAPESVKARKKKLRDDTEIFSNINLFFPRCKNA